jgi:hypothetical protein
VTLCGLYYCLGVGDNHLTEVRYFVGRLHKGGKVGFGFFFAGLHFGKHGKGEDIGRPVPAQVHGIQPLYFFLVDNDQTKLRLGVGIFGSEDFPGYSLQPVRLGTAFKAFIK